ncbi:pimeloyl-ACP methyl ester carboxylesterase [Xanthomonas arboricola]|uniref:alpha/beta hydrolase family protein n=1 Tax=Xanthomonas euroxanthea TaxID=2259622 RepID=UPI00141AB387|nr:alpha/beta fold hydrolase [Xanthomonas euroxanthea]NIK40465.1 pimeloyl-ACP methyl ester carboxylesterase [Xanthomonas euroxanthea]
MNNLINFARHLPVRAPVSTASYSTVALSAPSRGLPLQLRVTAPVSGDVLPIILLSHGHGPSLYLPSKDGYAPLAGFYAEQGFVVIQPTHANSKVAGLPAGSPGAPLFLRSRATDFSLVLDQLPDIQAQVPHLAGRLDTARIAVVGHSLGGMTASMLLGARIPDITSPGNTFLDFFEPRLKAGVILAGPGHGDGLSEMAARSYPELHPDFTHMRTPTMVVTGEHDVSPHMTVRGADWHADPYHLSPGATTLLTLTGGRHGLGGISGYDAKEADDEDPDRLATTQRMTAAWLRSALYEGDDTWHAAAEALRSDAPTLGTIETK